jgi:hypothetical protein
MNDLIVAGKANVRALTSTGIDSYALGYSEAELQHLRFQGEYFRDLTESLSSGLQLNVCPGAAAPHAQVTRIGAAVTLSRDDDDSLNGPSPLHTNLALGVRQRGRRPRRR